MTQFKPSSLLMELLKCNWILAATALILAILSSLLEGISASLAMPLFEILENTSTSTNLELPNFLQQLNSIFFQFPENRRLLAVIFVFFIITILKNLILYQSIIRINKLKLQSGLLIRSRLIERFLNIELSFYSYAKQGELISYINEHVQRSESLFAYILQIVRNLITIFILLILLISISPILTVSIVTCLLLVTAFIHPIVKNVKTNGVKVAKSIDEFSSYVTEILCGIRVVKAFNAESRELKKSQSILRRRYKVELLAHLYSSAVSPLTETLGITILLFFIAAASTLLSNSINLPILLTYTLALLRILPRLSHLNSMRSELSLFSGSLAVIEKFLYITRDLYQVSGSQLYQNFKHELVLKNVTFTFPEKSKPTLKGINLHIYKGTLTALVGASGSGKSTLVDIIMRFRDPNEGSIRVDGIDLKEFQIESWQKSIAVVSQNTFLFHASIRENIIYSSPNATELEIIEVAKKAYAYEFIQELPQGFDTVVGNRGTKLSGGQCQRIAIARALLRNPDILILDEATSSLDINSERIVQQAIEQISIDRTVIAIAHRLSTIKKADNIIVLKEGIVVEQGTHSELLEHRGEYWSLYQSQFHPSNSVTS
ncbi:ABC transporter ATP-binding protein [Oscillatoriales cyanobacterium LEGE 11467]|uniref:ABC transporter ATP-binding protein n=1 Tax=Zarconia navalis LEGE 11467 TaxID=1828826 RepID=A0A928VUS2_9CYAN|nr:ABC transporter ATP-binding protein [Zarconia navalis]MBE9039854.1 ABC transporter ATP-binding protein [Zarconia navalis LEGE 11467]